MVVIPGSSVLVGSRVVTWLRRVSVAWIGVELLLIIPDIHGMTGVIVVHVVVRRLRWLVVLPLIIRS